MSGVWPRRPGSPVDVRAGHHDPETCPSPVADTRVTMRYQPDKPSYYDNLPDFWVRWHDEYVNTTHPRLAARKSTGGTRRFG